MNAFSFPFHFPLLNSTKFTISATVPGIGVGSLNPQLDASTSIMMGSHLIREAEDKRFQQRYFQLVSSVLLETIASTCRACKKGRGCCSLSKKRLRKIWNGKNLIRSNEWKNLNVLRLQQIKTINGNVVIMKYRNNGRIYNRFDFSHNNKRCKNHDLIGSPLPNLLNK